MPRPSQAEDRRKAFLPVIARTFTELGYRRTTTAALAQRCGVQENVLYRLWPDKKAMFIAAIGYVYELSAATWARLLRSHSTRETHAERVLAYESQHHGEFSHYRIVFAGLSEADDPEIRAALADMFRRFADLLSSEIRSHRATNGDAAGRDGGSQPPDAQLCAWSIIGLGTIANIVRELGLFSNADRTRLIQEVGRMLLRGGSPAEDAAPRREVDRHALTR